MPYGLARVVWLASPVLSGRPASGCKRTASRPLSSVVCPLLSTLRKEQWIEVTEKWLAPYLDY